MAIFLISLYLTLLFIAIAYFALKKIDDGFDYIIVEAFGPNNGTSKTERKTIFNQKIIIKWIAFASLMISLFVTFALACFMVLKHMDSTDIIQKALGLFTGTGFSAGFWRLFNKVNADAKDLE